MKETIHALFEESIDTARRSTALAPVVEDAAQILIDALTRGHKILICGNGGSAADAQHFAAELVGRFEKERRALPCVALTTDTSILTAWSNDYAYETVFARQIGALGAPGDVLLGISTSGSSPNVIKAMKEAGHRGLQRIALTGHDGGALKDMPDVCQVVVASNQTARIQEVHIIILHIWSKLVEDACG